MRIMVTGAGGLLGSDVSLVAAGSGHEVIALDRDGLDVTDPGAVDAVVRGAHPDAVVQCAAFTHVDRAEGEPAMAMRVNRDGAALMAAACRSVGAVMVYVSTDYVFGGPRDRPWSPREAAHPANHYGRSKLEGERAVADAGGEHVVARVSWLFGQGRPSFIDGMVARAQAGQALRLTDDQFSTPTWTAGAAATLVELLERGGRGVFHVTGGGEAVSRLDFVSEALRILDLDVPVEGVPTGTFPEPARRAPYTVLDVASTEAFLGHPLTGWREGLRRHLSGGR
jgi:dTDP-4-dehydrorhamnose reductase